MKKRALLVLLAIVLLLGTIITCTVLGLSEPLPRGQAGPEAEALASKIEKAIGFEAWRKQTAAIEFIFVKRNSHHFRDLRRDLVEVRTGNTRVLYSNKDRSKFLAFQNGEKLEGQAARKAVYQAISYHTNDLFWMNPWSMLRAPGTTRQLVGKQALLLSFKSGGVTPGDSYLIVTDENGLPTRIQMWASVLPLDGMEWSCEDWFQSETGVMLNRYYAGLKDVKLKDVKTYPAYPGENKDRFAELLPLMK